LRAKRIGARKNENKTKTSLFVWNKASEINNGKNKPMVWGGNFCQNNQKIRKTEGNQYERKSEK